MKRSRAKPTKWLCRHLGFLCTLFLIMMGCAPPLVNNPPIKQFCPSDPPPRTVEIKEADPQIDKEHHDLMLGQLIQAVSTANTTTLLGPDVILDFSEWNDERGYVMKFAPCVTLISVSAFGETPQSARTPHSLGPLLIFGQHRSSGKKVFLLIDCRAGDQASDNIRISGFRLYGPSMDQQDVEDIGIKVFRCLNIEISNMEIAGWGGQAIQVEDDPEQGPGQEQPNNRDGERIGRPDEIRIFNNYIHNNQHPRTTFGDHSAGYGVDVHHGAWAQIYQNVFDFNRHAIAAAGDTGGYEALRNLVLKGGGIHYETFDINTHQFDIHGSGNNGFGGQAGIQFWFANNAFQYLAGSAIEIRGRPNLRIYIHDNVFAHDALDDAIHVNDNNDLDVIEIGPNNTLDFDSYGRYGVCDFDGDGIDDLFLATAQTWWYSSYGEFQWTYLSAHTEHFDQVRLGYFDNDQRCDVLTQSGAEWVISSGGIGEWYSIGAFGAQLSEVAFGQFDPNIRDHGPGVTRRATHAFWRRQDGDWLVTSLSAPAWREVGSSSFPMSKLQFGDFTGDGVTDVLAVQDGRWSISESAISPWKILNPNLADDVRSIYIADLNNNNIDDLIKPEDTFSNGIETFTWWVSDDGRSAWRMLKTYTLSADKDSVPIFTFAGRFGAAPGGGVLLIDHYRIGHFFSEAEITAGASPDWTSLFPY